MNLAKNWKISRYEKSLLSIHLTYYLELFICGKHPIYNEKWPFPQKYHRVQ